MGDDWETLDTSEVLRKQRQQQEQTTSGNVGGYPVPLGPPLRRQVPETPPKKKPKKKGS